MSNNQETCPLDVTIYQACPANCRGMLELNKWDLGIISKCIAKKKLKEFIYGKNTFSVAFSAFQQAQPFIIQEFIESDEASRDLIRYFFSIGNPEDIISLASNLPVKSLYELFRIDYENFEKTKKANPRGNRTNYFQIKSNQYWTKIPATKLVKLIEFLIKEKIDYKLASVFLMILSPENIASLSENISMTKDEERNLYLNLGDNIYELPLVSPGIYTHMMDLFLENPEIFFVLQTMEELVKRKKVVIDTTRFMIEGYKKLNTSLSIQSIYSELYGLEIELIMEILNQLREKNVITLSEKESLQHLFEKGGLEFIRGIRSEIIK